MKHTMKLNAAPFAMIKSGQKRVEMRLYDEKRRQIKIDDEILFAHAETGEILPCKVKGLCICGDFNQLYSRYNPMVLGYSADEKADPQDMLAYYSQENIDAYGVVGIEVKKLP